MIRPLIIIINIFIGFIVNLFLGTPTATVTAPASVSAGSSFVVEAKIKPNGEEGFMRFSMELPAGWSASQMETDGGTVMFEGQVVKVLWSRVGPGREELKISYKVNVPADANGDVALPCKVSHTVNNLPSHVVLDPVKITVGNGSGNANVSKENTADEDTMALPKADVTSFRSISEISKGEYVVDITLTKGELKNFGKVQDSLPQGITAKLLKSDGADFEFKNGIVKFTWYQLPKKNMINIQYSIVVSPDLNGPQTIKGHFSYVEDEKGKLHEIVPTTFTVAMNPALANNTPDNNQQPANNNPVQNNAPQNNQNNNQNTTAQNNAAKESQNASQQQNVATNNTDKPTDKNKEDKNVQPAAPDKTATTATVQGVFFSVQIAAMQRMVPVSYYTSTYNLSSVNAEQIDGLNKYTTGKFNTYKEARDHREVIRTKGVQGPFVAAYSGGKRITVQEALMISSQQWVR